MPFCARCGRELAPNSNFCHNCGAPVSASTNVSGVTHFAFKVSAVPQLIVRNESAGSVQVKNGPEGEVVVDFDPRDSTYLEWNAVQNGEVITVTCRHKPGTWPSYLPITGARSRFSIVVPKKTNALIDCRFGPIEIVGVQGNVSAETSTGEVQIQNCDGSVDAKTKTGRIKLDRVNGSVSASNYAGSIDYSGTLSGDNWFRARAGTIEIALLGEPDLSVDAVARVGRVSIDPILKMSTSQMEQYMVGNRIYGSIGAGKTGRLHAETYTGSIWIRKGTS